MNTLDRLRSEANAAALAYSQAVVAAEKTLEAYRKAHNAVLTEEAHQLLKNLPLSEHERRVHEATRDRMTNMQSETIQVGDEVFYEGAEVILDVTKVTDSEVWGEDGGTLYVVPRDACQLVREGDY